MFIAARLIGAAASALTVPAALASVALAYRGVARATALGIAYAIYSGALAVMPILLTFIPGAQWPGFVVAPIAALIALFVVRGRIPDLERPGHLERPYVLGTALWASAVVAISVGVLWLGTGWEHPLRWAIIGFGVALLVAFRTWERRRRITHPADLQVDRRPVTVALFAGVVIALAQSAPMLILPQYFAIVPRFGPVFGMLAIAPLIAGLVIAGPVAGYLLARFPPRVLVGGGPGHRRPRQHRGRADRGARDRLRAVHPAAPADRCRVRRRARPCGRRSSSRASRAACPRPRRRSTRPRWPSAPGSGIVLVTAIVATVALSTYDASVAGLAPAAAAEARQQFADVLYAVGTPSFPALARAIQPDLVLGYLDAYVAGVRTALFLGGAAAVLGGFVAWLGLGRRDPLATRGTDAMASVYEHRDERVTAEP